MHLVIKYAQESPLPGAVEVYDTLPTSSWEWSRAQFAEVEPGVWGVAVMRAKAGQEKLIWMRERTLLRHEAASQDEYMSWLRSMVDYIEADDHNLFKAE